MNVKKAVGIGFLSLYTLVSSAYAGNGGIIYENNVPEESGTLNDEAKYTIDEQIKRNGFMGFVTGLFTWPLRIVPSTLYGLTNQIPESKNPIEYVGKTVINGVKGAWENKLETIVSVAVPVGINNLKPTHGGNAIIQGGD